MTTLGVSAARSREGAALPTLAVLGAGNCNDIDLATLAPLYREIHLVDLDEDALAAVHARQPANVAEKLRLRAPVDLSGAFARLAAFARKPATNAELALLPRTSLEQVRVALPETFDVVLSTCFLSQLMQSAFAALGEKHPQLRLIASALALAHLRTVVALARSGGSAHIVTDTVSDETYPLVELWGQQPPAALLDHLEKTDNVFSGTGPSFVRRILATDREVAQHLAGAPRLTEPWLWRFGAARTYLVYACSIERHP